MINRLTHSVDTVLLSTQKKPEAMTEILKPQSLDQTYNNAVG